jgi:hypothetical protein
MVAYSLLLVGFACGALGQESPVPTDFVQTLFSFGTEENYCRWFSLVLK